jgi:hypothetical protein
MVSPYNVVKWPVCRSVVVQSVVLPRLVHTGGSVPAIVLDRSISLSGATVECKKTPNNS